MNLKIRLSGFFVIFGHPCPDIQGLAVLKNGQQQDEQAIISFLIISSRTAMTKQLWKKVWIMTLWSHSIIFFDKSWLILFAIFSEANIFFGDKDIFAGGCVESKLYLLASLDRNT